jgi:hypothetical protein
MLLEATQQRGDAELAGVEDAVGVEGGLECRQHVGARAERLGHVAAPVQSLGNVD